MILEHLLTEIKDMTEEQLLEHVRKMRHNRSVERPAAKMRKAKAERKDEVKLSKALLSKINAMSPADREALILQLESEASNDAAAAEEGGDEESIGGEDSPDGEVS